MYITPRKFLCNLCLDSGIMYHNRPPLGSMGAQLGAPQTPTKWNLSKIPYSITVQWNIE